MPNKIIAVPLDESLGSFIGKKGSEGSITFYNRKLDDGVLVAMAPAELGEKISALPSTLLMAEQIVVSTATIDRLFGEVLIASLLLGKRIIFTKDGDISGLIAGMDTGTFSFADRNDLIDKILAYKTESNGGETRVEVDRCFNVKGSGTVLLGIVTRGTVAKHDMFISKDGKEITVRSIQCQDVDVDSAEIGSRVGLAIKGADENDLKKGDILSKAKIPAVSSINVELVQSPLAKEAISAGKQYSFFFGFSSCSCMVEAVASGKASLKLDKGMQIQKGDTIMIGRQSAPRIFASGRVE